MSVGLAAAGLWLGVGIADAQSLPGAPSAVTKQTSTVTQSATTAASAAVQSATKPASGETQAAPKATAPKPSSVMSSTSAQQVAPKGTTVAATASGQVQAVATSAQTGVATAPPTQVQATSKAVESTVTSAAPTTAVPPTSPEPLATAEVTPIVEDVDNAAESAAPDAAQDLADAASVTDAIDGAQALAPDTVQTLVNPATDADAIGTPEALAPDTVQTLVNAATDADAIGTPEALAPDAVQALNDVAAEADATLAGAGVEPILQPVVAPVVKVLAPVVQDVEEPPADALERNVEPAPIALDPPKPSEQPLSVSRSESGGAAGEPIIDVLVATPVALDLPTVRLARLNADLSIASAPARPMRTSTATLASVTVASLEAAEPILPDHLVSTPAVNRSARPPDLAEILDATLEPAPANPPLAAAFHGLSAPDLLGPAPHTFALPAPAFEPLGSTAPPPPAPASPPHAQFATGNVPSPGQGGLNTLGSSGASAALPPGFLPFAATWRALAATAQGRPASISLPELAPPG